MTIVAANPNDPARPDLPDGTGFSVLAVLPDGTFDLMIDEPTAEERLASLVETLTAQVDALLDALGGSDG
jgi:hypothetical protein